MRILLVIVLIFQCTRCVLAEPLTVKEIGLMLRCGDSSESILRNLSVRHFAGRVDPTAEKKLREANASPALIAALKSGNNAASAGEVAQARQLANAQKAFVQKRIAVLEASQQAARMPPNRQIVVAQMPGTDQTALLPSEKAAAELHPNLNPEELGSLLPSEKVAANATKGAAIAAAQAAARAEWCAAHPVECAQEEAKARAREEAAREEAAHQEADEVKRKYESAIREVKFSGHPSDVVEFGLPKFPNSSEAQDVQRRYQSELDAAKRDADEEAKRDADKEAKRQVDDGRY
jgi:hypothetical protein